MDKLFLARYKKRILDLQDGVFNLEYAYKIYNEKGEDQFLVELEDAEDLCEFYHTYYMFLRTYFNACSAGMVDWHKSFVDKYNRDHTKFQEYITKLAGPNVRFF